MKCLDCSEDLKPNRRRAVMSLGLEPRCVGCQLMHETQKPLQLRPENVKGIAVGGDFDETDTHFRERQGIL